MCLESGASAVQLLVFAFFFVADSVTLLQRHMQSKHQEMSSWITCDMASGDGLTTFYRGDSIFQSTTFNPEGHTTNFPDHYENLVYFLSVIQHFQVNIIPVTWQPALDSLGRGTSAVVNQSMVHASLNYAFKRCGLDTPYSTLISEVAILSLPRIRGHANVNGLEGICWELPVRDPDMGPAVRPVLVSSKADFGDLRRFLKSEAGMNFSLRQKLDICLDIARAVDELHHCGAGTLELFNKSWILTPY